MPIDGEAAPQLKIWWWGKSKNLAFGGAKQALKAILVFFYIFTKKFLAVPSAEQI